ncbi:MAG: fatty acid CoA ligase family protein [Anaerolineae bacterium]
MTRQHAEQFNIAQPMVEAAARVPYRRAIVFPAGREPDGTARYTQLTFQQLDRESDRYAHGLARYGVRQGERTLVMIRPGIAFIAVTFALLKIGAVPVFVDPGLLRRDPRAFMQCVRETEPVHFIGIPVAHLLRLLFPGAFRTVQRHVTVGRRWFWGGPRLAELRSGQDAPYPTAATTTEHEAAVAFTSGSTGIPKGVVFTHGMFKAQIDLIHEEMGYADGDVDLPGLYVFALYNPALGVTTIIPDMDPSRLAALDPARLVEAIQTHGVTTSNGSPTIYKKVAAYCLENEIRLPSLKRILTYGAPVPPSLIEQCGQILDGGEVDTPYGATEALPITMISGREILAETAALSDQGRGTCVGRPTTGNTIRIIRITEDPIPVWDPALVLPDGEVGEIAVKGPVVTRTYLHRPVQTAETKIREGDEIWHRMGDLGYFDDQGRLWFCGRKRHRVEAAEGLLLPVQCEAILNQHPDVYRSAVVGVGPLGRQRPVLIVEPVREKWPTSAEARGRLIEELRSLGAAHTITRGIHDVLFYRDLPVDVRHNAKIQREKLAAWAARQLGEAAE